ncbi:hypothetical protein [Pararhodobacter sp.]|uniref:hypothetical protein n=1 Tax=Pararhodobacter sp. TaxID=2127056 RepID=UPI002FDE9C4C
MRIAHTRPDAEFSDAFAAARLAGCAEFVWRGARYHTRREDDPVLPRPPVIERIEEI